MVTAGFSALAQEANFDVYPNPATSNISVSFESTENYSIIITNLLGTEVFRQEVSSWKSKSFINLNDIGLNTGMYLIKIEVKGVTKNQKRLIIKKA